MDYIVISFISFLFTAVATFIMIKVATKFKIFDIPREKRKIHIKPIPLLGGVAIYISFFLVLFFLKDRILSGNLELHHWLGVLAGASFLVVGGILDDKYNLKPRLQIIFPVLAALSVIAGGVGIDKITNPFGADYLYLNDLKIPILSLNGQMHYFVIIADTFTFLWILGMIYTTKIMDGIDGLVSGVAGIGSLIIFLFTLTTKYYQPDVGIAALVLAACCAGFLMYNWNPASIFLGESGSTLLGFILGVLSIISGGKIAIALLIMGIPIMDVLWTIIRRFRSGENPFKSADRKHLHFRLLDLGIGQKKTVLIYYLFSLIFGLSALFLQSRGKTLAIGMMGLIMIIFIAVFNYIDRKEAK